MIDWCSTNKHIDFTFIRYVHHHQKFVPLRQTHQQELGCFSFSRGVNWTRRRRRCPQCWQFSRTPFVLIRLFNTFIVTACCLTKQKEKFYFIIINNNIFYLTLTSIGIGAGIGFCFRCRRWWVCGFLRCFRDLCRAKLLSLSLLAAISISLLLLLTLTSAKLTSSTSSPLLSSSLSLLSSLSGG